MRIGRCRPALATLSAALVAIGVGTNVAVAGGDQVPELRLSRQPLQAIDGWGGAVTGTRFLDPLADYGSTDTATLRRMDEALFGRGGINLMRIFGPVKLDPRDGRLRMMRRLYPRGVRFLLTGEAPPSMKSGLALRPGREQAYADFVTRLLKLANRQGTPFSWVAVGNEVDNYKLPVGTRLSAAQSGRFYARLAANLRENGLPTRIAVGDTTGWSATLTYGAAILRRSGVRRYADVLASHGYFCCPRLRPAVARLARRYQLSFWMTEFTAGCAAGNCPDTPSMTHALRWARRITVDLRAGVSGWFVFRAADDSTHGPDEGLIVRQRGNRRRPFYLTKRYFVLRQYTLAAPEGARRLRNSSAAGLPSLGFRRPDGTLSVVVANTGSRSRLLRINFGTDQNGRLLIRRTSRSNNFAELPGRRYPGEPVLMRLPAKSATTVVLADEGSAR